LHLAYHARILSNESGPKERKRKWRGRALLKED
jgi:hypothetical protein